MIAIRRPRLNPDRVACLLLVAFGLVFFAANATLRLATDDVRWLLGQPPTVFDQYRVIPRLSFAALHALFGQSAAAALAMIFLFHALNALFVYRLGQKLLAGRIAPWAAVAVFFVNPITLKTLTWISCFSYVQGTSLALASLLAAMKAGDARGRLRWLWLAAALAAFGVGLFCSHELLFLPVVLFALCAFRGDYWGGFVLLAAGTALALVVNQWVYDFQRYGIDGARLFTFDFALAYLSSGLSSGLALAAAYPISFFARTQDLLRVSFAEPVRWGMTAALAVAGILLARKTRGRALLLALALAFAALITPYVVRLYLTPDTASFHISYVLSGRVFYVPFVVLALILGWAVAWFWRAVRGRRGAWLLAFVPPIACARALWLYDKADFLGLNVMTGAAGAMPPRWNPYLGQHPAWLLVAVLAALAALAWRWAAARHGRSENL